jgi:hydrogenase maturation factor
MSPTGHTDRQDGSCQVCGDVAVQGRVMALDADTHTAIVALECGTATVALDLVEANVGDTLLVHLGFAITRVDVA